MSRHESRRDVRSVLRRRRRLTILLRPGAGTSPVTAVSSTTTSATETNPAAPAVNATPTAYSAAHILNVFKARWDRWTAAIKEGRIQAMELVSQYPTGSNVSAMLDLEALIPKMEQVTLV